ncbi:MAG: hypothetical protein AB2565_00200 [Candidatus Thiodiazotropha endolucinida]|uniref:Uncharacterized protein n=2 Tax=Candidatus Thiodiazotropha TaxID=1913444 RepID=A0A7Z0VP66_9GAMM|nr:hypothetical protein [Candidatus Thiodiazotropha endolucinida]MCG7980659.1 hypothetical protein [Candidatus Thiodiazotropha taylori]MCW4238799.1 hypothetical protein [Candidatus Thiodiazotropha endolucinida]ODJ89220.1 hypothetical protein CODIS_03190 [Candidatus Thiodiazotropha endolucinida]
MTNSHSICDLNLLPELERQTDNDVRWSAAATLTDYAMYLPDHVWPIILKHGSSSDEDLRTAVATCLLEHLLEYHFEAYFSKLEKVILDSNNNLKDTLSLCWKLGKSELPENSARWEPLIQSN